MYDSNKNRFLIVCLDGEVSSFQKIKECAEYKRKIDEMILGKKLAKSKWAKVRFPSSRYCETLHDKVSIEKYLIDLYLYGYDIEKVLKYALMIMFVEVSTIKNYISL